MVEKKKKRLVEEFYKRSFMIKNLILLAGSHFKFLFRTTFLIAVNMKHQ